MGRLSQIGGAMIGAAVALDAGEALSQGPDQARRPGEYVGRSGQFNTLSPETCERIKGAVNVNLGNATTGQMMSSTEVRSSLVDNGEALEDMGGSIYREYEPFTCVGQDPVTGGFLFQSYLYRTRIPEGGVILSLSRDGDRCYLAEGWVHKFEGPLPFATNGAQGIFLVLPPGILDTAKIECPKPKDVTNSTDSAYQAALTRIEAGFSPKVEETPKVVTAPEYVPHPGEFADLEPKLVEQGVFLVPVRELNLTEEVPAELVGPAYTSQTDQAKGKRIVYRQYVLDGYEPKTGMVRVHDGGNMEQCVETASYEDKMLGDKTSYILSVPGSPEMKNVVCKETVETPAPATVKAMPKESKPWELPVRAGLAVGADVEETSEYSLGNAPALHLSVQTQPFAFPLEFGFSGDFIFTEDGSGLEGVDLMVGGQPIRKVPVRAYLTVGDSFEARDRYKETTLNGAFSYGAKVEGDVYEFSLLHQAMAVNCHVNAQQHLYGGGGLSVWNVGGGCGLVWDYVVSGGGREVKERPVVSDAAVSVAAVEEQPKGPHLEMETKPYSYRLPTFKETKSEEKKAELVRLSEEMQKRARDNKWDAVELRYDDARKLGIPLSYRDHKNGAEAARAAGNMQECYERLLIAQPIAINDFDKKEVEQWIAEIEASYARVGIVIKANGEVTLEASQMPFPPDQRAAITFAQAEVVDGSFEGLLPLISNLDGAQGTYTLNGQTIKISDLRTLSTKTTTEIRLEK